VLGISYSHFRAGPSDDVVRTAIAGAQSWSEAVMAAGYDEESGSARAQLRKRCSVLGLSTQHLDRPRIAPDQPWASLSLEHLRDAGPMLVAGFLTLAGCRVSWPLEPAPYDLLADGPAGLQRIQVKTSTRKTGDSWQCRLTRSVYDGASGFSVPGYYTPGEIDAYAIVDGDLLVYLIPFGLLCGQATIQVSRYSAFRLGMQAEDARTIR